MEKDQEQIAMFLKSWKKLLIDVGMTEGEVATMIGTSQANLNKKMNKGTIRHIELVSILDKLGYTVQFVKKS